MWAFPRVMSPPQPAADTSGAFWSTGFGRYLADELSSFLRLLHVERLRRLPADALHPVQIGPVLFLETDAVQIAQCLCQGTTSGVGTGGPVHETYIALESISLLRPGNAPISRQRGVLVQEGPVVGLGRQVLGLLGMADVHHIRH